MRTDDRLSVLPLDDLDGSQERDPESAMQIPARGERSGTAR